MGRRNENSKRLKRVDGELQLAPIKPDLQRPPTAGLHLKKCSSSTNISSSDSVPTHFIYKDERSTENSGTVSSYESENLRVPMPSQDTFESLEGSSMVPYAAEVMPDPEVVANNALVSISERIEVQERRCQTGVSSGRRSSRIEKTVTILPVPTFFSDTTYTTRAALSSAMTVEERKGGHSTTISRVDTVVTTATTLSLPESIRNLSSSLISPAWSTLNQIGTDQSKIDATTISLSTSSSPSKASNGSKYSDRDTWSNALPEAPPASPATSGSDKPPFTLTFRRPKPIPRNTGKPVSVEQSFPTTASTPNPEEIKPEDDTAAEVEVDTNNNEPDSNNNIEDDNNNPVEVKKDKEHDKSLLSMVEQPVFGNENEFIVQAAETAKEDESASFESYSSITNNKSDEDFDAEQTEATTTVGRTLAPSAPAFVTTERGAIRFVLPGRIQHKTTIKVAHFPTDDKNVTLNVKAPDSDDDDDPIQMPCGPGHNNQNYCMPPPPIEPYDNYDYPPCYGPYSYPPYCYPPPPPPYYGGYPPYY